MKRWFWAILLGSLALLWASCGGSNPDVDNSDAVQRISPKDAKALLDEGKAVLYDARSADAHRIQHAAGAVSFPEEQAPARIHELPDDGTALIFYCT